MGDRHMAVHVHRDVQTVVSPVGLWPTGTVNSTRGCAEASGCDRRLSSSTWHFRITVVPCSVLV